MEFAMEPRQQQNKFSPYDDNGGSIVGIAGDDFALIASDTRLSTGYSIYTRNQSKLFKLSSKFVLGCSGCWCDTLQLTKVLEARIKMYLHENNKPITTAALAQLLAINLYYKRFFPYYVSNILAGLDTDGSGAIFSYDPVGHYERNKFVAGGSSGALFQPLLDNQLGFLNMQNVEKQPITIDKALAIVKDVFISAAERDIYTGDSIHILIITSDGIREDIVQLRKD